MIVHTYNLMLWMLKQNDCHEFKASIGKGGRRGGGRMKEEEEEERKEEEEGKRKKKLFFKILF